MLNTRSKLHIARLASRLLLAARSLCGFGDTTEVNRGGLKWSLDLREGIDLAIYLGVYETATMRLLSNRLHAGDVAVDIGANIGALSLPLARLVGAHGQVHAFEPTAYAYQKLCRNLALNGDAAAQVSAQQLMLVEDSAAALDVALYASWPLRGSGSELHPLHRGALKSLAGAAAMSLDDYLARHAITRVNLIKLDVDGNELRVLRGARTTLLHRRPLLVLELAPYILDEQPGTLEDILALLNECGYQLFKMSDGRRLPNDAQALRAWIPYGSGLNIIGEAA